MRKPRKKKLIELIEDAHGNLTAVATACEVTRRTVSRWVKDDEEIEEVIQQSRESMLDIAENKLKEKLEAGSEKMIEFTLKTLGRNRGYVERIEHMEHVEQELFPPDEHDDTGEFPDEDQTDLDEDI